MAFMQIPPHPSCTITTSPCVQFSYISRCKFTLISPLFISPIQKKKNPSWPYIKCKVLDKAFKDLDNLALSSLAGMLFYQMLLSTLHYYHCLYIQEFTCLTFVFLFSCALFMPFPEPKMNSPLLYYIIILTAQGSAQLQVPL